MTSWEGACAARARGVLMMKILNKCILSILVYNLVLDRQRHILYTPQYFLTPVYLLAVFIKQNFKLSKNTAIFPYTGIFIGCLHETEHQTFKKYGWLGEKKFDTNDSYCIWICRIQIYYFIISSQIKRCFVIP